MKNCRMLVIVALTVSISASVFAGEPADKPVRSKRVQILRAEKKDCTVRFSGSPFPQPCDRLAEMPATAEPMHIIGSLPPVQHR